MWLDNSQSVPLFKTLSSESNTDDEYKAYTEYL